MAIVACVECNKDVSDSAFKCPNCGVTLKKPKRGFFGKLFKFAFVLFNILMCVWLFSYFSDVGEFISSNSDEASQAGAAIGATLGTGFILSFWVIGDIILGIIVLLTRPKQL